MTAKPLKQMIWDQRERETEQGCHPGQVIDLAELSAPYWEEGKDHSGPGTEGRVEEGTVLGPLGLWNEGILVWLPGFFQEAKKLNWNPVFLFRLP